MNNRQVAHAWAQQSRAEFWDHYQRASGRGSNFFFEGRSIFSYGAHFEIARFVERNGARAVLFTRRRYSVSTSRHISYTRSALHGLDVPVFNVAALDAAPAENFKGYQTEVREAAESAARSRTKGDWLISEAQRIANEGNEFAAFFGLRQRIPRPELSAELRARVAAQRIKNREANAARNAERALRLAYAPMARAINAALWRAGRPSLKGFDLITSDCGPTLLRVRGDVIETSRGAEFPAAHGLKAFPIIAAMREHGKTWQRNGHSIHLGHFAIDSIDAAGNVRAGCHFVEWSEIERCARALGVQS